MANAKPNLDPEERNLLSVAFKNAVGSRRHAWRNVQEPECPRTDQASIDMFEALYVYPPQNNCAGCIAP